MKLVYNPWRELNDVHHHLCHLLDHHHHHNPQEEALTGVEWSPLVDIVEDEKEFSINIELPALKKEDVKIRIEEGTLIISGERKSEKEEQGKKFHRIERSYGSFMRSFSIPSGVDEKKIKAEFKEGLLVLHLPKVEGAQGRSLEVKID